MRLNIIKEEILRQWQKGYIKMLLIVILLISILMGYIHVYRVKESYNNIMNITKEWYKLWAFRKGYKRV